MPLRDFWDYLREDEDEHQELLFDEEHVPNFNKLSEEELIEYLADAEDGPSIEEYWCESAATLQCGPQCCHDSTIMYIHILLRLIHILLRLIHSYSLDYRKNMSLVCSNYCLSLLRTQFSDA